MSASASSTSHSSTSHSSTGNPTAKRRDPRENTRRHERFQVRAQALFLARVAFLTLGVGVMLVPDWRTAVGVSGWGSFIWFLIVVGYSAANFFVVRRKPKHAIRVTFVTLCADLLLLVYLIAASGGVRSPVMAAQLIYSIFFALLFP